MTTLQDLALDQQVTARVIAAERRFRPSPQAEPVRDDWLSVENGLVSNGARRRDALYRRSLMIADLLAAAAALVLAVTVVGDAGLRLVLLLGIPVVVVLSKVLGLYDRDEYVFHKSTLDELPKHFELAMTYTLVVWFLAPALIEGTFTRRAGLALCASCFVATAMLRTLARGFARRVGPLDRCLIVGRSGTRTRLAAKLTAAQPGTDVVGYLPLEDERSSHRAAWDGQDRRRHTLTIQDLPELARQLDVHRVIIIPGEADPEAMIDAISRAKAAGVKVSILPRLFEVVGSSVEVDDIEGVTVLGVRRFGLSRSSQLVKRGMDVVAAAFGLLVTAPVFAVVALAIKLDSRGPIFYKQLRIGRDGQAFTMYKFRSMIDGADALRRALAARSIAGDGLFKVVDDPRITRVGVIIRKLSLDELPQLLNVLRGEMSLVGPRPLVADEAERVGGRFRRRLRLTPGMTGPWQVLGPTRVPLTEMVGLDYLYGANWSLWLDLKIIMRTLVHVLSRSGV
jgi:exopolysaccharide biosynthesis polyprenyl glycosylphosphotransferase